jgi:predicted outer membrane repeat protein
MRLLCFLTPVCAITAQKCLSKISVSNKKDADKLVAAAACAGADITAIWHGLVQPPAIVVGNGTSLTITGSGTAVIDGANATRLFNVQGGTLILKDLTLSNGNATGFGAAVNGTAADIHAVNITFKHNTAGGAGGAISCVQNCNLLLDNCTFNSNTAKWGGSVYVAGYSMLTIRDTVVTDSTSTTEGAGIYLYGSTGTISTSLITSCNSTNDGGGVLMQASSKVTISDCIFENNTCGGAGGSISCTSSSRLDVHSSTFLNSTAQFGSAISISGADTAVNVNSSVFTGGSVGVSGGAIYSESRNLNISTSIFSDNNADIGGAVLCADVTVSKFTSNSFSNNHAKKRYGGMYTLWHSTSLVLVYCMFLHCQLSMRLQSVTCICAARCCLDEYFLAAVLLTDTMPILYIAYTQELSTLVINQCLH